MGWLEAIIGVLSFLLVVTNGLWFRWWYLHQPKCLWAKEKGEKSHEWMRLLYDIEARGFGMMEFHRVNPDNVYMVKP